MGDVGWSVFPFHSFSRALRVPQPLDSQPCPDHCPHTSSLQLPGRERDDLLQMTSALGQRLEEWRQPPREDVPGGPFPPPLPPPPVSMPSLHIKAEPPPRPLALPTPLRCAP